MHNKVMQRGVQFIIAKVQLDKQRTLLTDITKAKEVRHSIGVASNGGAHNNTSTVTKARTRIRNRCRARTVTA